MRSTVGRTGTFPALVVAVLAGLLPVAVVLTLGTRAVDVPNWTHIYLVGGSALLATAAAFVVTALGVRRNDARAVLAGMAFSTMAAILAVHGLATPGELIGPNSLVAVSGGATLPVGAVILALGAHVPVRRPARLRPLLWVQFGLMAAILGTSVLGAAFPVLLPRVPAADSAPALALLAATTGALLLVAARAFRTYCLTRRAGDLLIVIGAGWLLAAAFGALTQRYDELGWWIGHVIEVVAIGLIGAPVTVDLLRTSPSYPLSGDLRAAELVRSAESFLDAQVRGLLARLAEKDAYTAAHTRNVALLAVQVGEELGLSPQRLRTIAIGGLVHDVGKLSVPDAILKKPAKLDDDEYREIQRHPVNGHELLGRLGGFSDEVRRLVLHHHERLDGGGYPLGLRAAELDLDTRILTVCDVFDALTANRVYREAWPVSRAVELLRSEQGTAFDPDCVAALERVIARADELLLAA